MTQEFVTLNNSVTLRLSAVSHFFIDRRALRVGMTSGNVVTIEANPNGNVSVYELERVLMKALGIS